MRTITASTMCVILVLSLINCFPGANAQVKTEPAKSLTEAKAANFTRTAALQDSIDDLRIEARKGEAVKLRGSQLRRKNKGVAQAMKDLEARGLRPAFDKGVSILAVSKSGRFTKSSAQQETTIVDGDVEMTFLPYENPDFNKWEGLIFARKPGKEVVHYGLLDISTENYFVIAERDYTNFNGNTPTQLRPVARNIGLPEYKLASFNASLPIVAALAQGSDDLQAWAVCSSAGCIGAAMLCTGTGPIWAGCAALGCLVVMLVCALTVLLT